MKTQPVCIIPFIHPNTLGAFIHILITTLNSEGKLKLKSNIPTDLPVQREQEYLVMGICLPCDKMSCNCKLKQPFCSYKHNWIYVG